MSSFVYVVALAMVCVLILLGLAITLAKTYHKVSSGKALIISKMGPGPQVSFSGAVVFPIVQKAEVMDISVKTIVIERKGQQAVTCKDGQTLELKATFTVAVNRTREDVLKVAQSVGCDRAGDMAVLEELFGSSFSEGLDIAASRMTADELQRDRQRYKDMVFEIIGMDLNGFVLENVAIEAVGLTVERDVQDPEGALAERGLSGVTVHLGKGAEEQLRRRPRLVILYLPEEGSFVARAS